jgi:tetratricopeptide (TPR) repeat protein
MFEEAAEIAEQADDRRGRAWALRGMADLVSVRDGDTERALGLLTDAEALCRAMDLAGALAYNHKMRGNVLFRAGRYAEARGLYEQALAEFTQLGEPRGTALSRLGLVKSRARLGREPARTSAELDELHTALRAVGLRHARRLVEDAREQLGLARPQQSPEEAAGDVPGEGVAA